ncbi:hypothetical protein K2P47_04010 [Patescibacteria group bacterium]|nr:hypothetical protein [Patescibacteria group bacterium]
MKTYFFTTLALLISSFFLAPGVSEAKVLYEQSKIGTPYDLFTDLGANGTGYVNRAPQHVGGPPFTFDSGGTAYEGTAEWLRVKRISGLGCETRFNISIFATDGTSIGDGRPRGGNINGEYCDFPIFGSNRTDKSVGLIAICVENDCDGIPSFVLDGSPLNSGYVFDGPEVFFEPGGWAFQICDIDGCSGGFGELATTTSTTTATTTPPTATSTGASSVLFLPGIQASRLYINPFILNEDQVWPPNSVLNNDIKDLSMSLSGSSEKNVYTRDIIDSTPGAGDIYQNFSDFMDQLDSENKIESWKPYAYDWRYSVKNIGENGTLYENGIKDVIDEIEALAEDSFTDKVTIIGHSNGGLLAKAIMQRLEVEGKSSLIDKVILLASPQLGTPKAIGTILHGYDQTDAIGGIIMDGQIVRKVLNNMPGAYGLLPSEKYFNGLSEPLIVFNDNSSTQPYRNIYGSSIFSYGEMVRYVKGEDGLDRSLESPISKPVRANVDLLDQALVNHNDLDNWVAPQGVEVIEIVGTGLPTMKAVEYREITETKCASAGAGGQVCVVEGEIKPYALLTHYGDGTVVQRSAEGYEGEKRKFFVNLDAIENSSLSGEYVHHNITEAPPVMKLLSDLIISTSTENNEFISTNYTTFNDSYDIEIIDSPVRLLSTDSQGNQTGVVVVNGVRTIKEEIPGSQYFEFGDTKYFVVPKGTNRTTKLYGEADGGYTLTTASFGVNDTQTVNTVLKNATTTPTMLAEYKNTGSQYSNITTDINGDGTIDTTTSISGVPVVVVSYPLLIAKIQSLSLLKIYKQALLIIINSAQVYANKTTQVTLNRKIERGLLTTAEELIKLYIKKGYLTQADGQALLQMITVLKNK